MEMWSGCERGPKQDGTGSKVWVHTVRIYDALNVKCCLIQSDIFSETAKTRFLLAGAFHTYPGNPTAAFTMHALPCRQCSGSV